MSDTPIYFCMSATAFGADGEFDPAVMRAHLSRMVSAGLGVYLGSGGAGEGHALSDAELRRVYEIGVEVCKGKVPVYANPPEQRTAAAMKRLCAIAVAAGVDVVQVYPPDPGHGMRPTDAELEAYYDDVLGSISAPTALSIHAVVGYITPLGMVVRLIARYPTIQAVNLIGVSANYIADLRAAIPARIKLYVPLAGCFDGFALGANGVLGAEPNILPTTAREFVEAVGRGDMVQATDRYRELLAFAQAVGPWSPSTARWVKMCLRALNLPGGAGGLRPPYLMPSDGDIAALAKRIGALGIAELRAGV